MTVSMETSRAWIGGTNAVVIFGWASEGKGLDTPSHTAPFLRVERESNMPRIYANPPLVEAVVALHIKEDDSWDWTIPGLLYGEIKSEFPNKAQEQSLQFEFSSNASSPRLQGTPSKMRFTGNSGELLVQVAPNLLTYNALTSGYKGWESFREGFLNVAMCYSKIYPTAQIERIGLRYINDIRVPYGKGKRIELARYFALGVRLPEMGGDYLVGDFLTRASLVFKEAETALQITFASIPKSESGAGGFRLDLDASTHSFEVRELSNSADAIEDWLEGAHDVVEAVFETSLTDETHTDILRADS